MYINFPVGKSKTFTNSEEAFDYLSSLDKKNIDIEPDNLKIFHQNNLLYLEVYKYYNIYQFPIRESFLLKLLKWHSFPPRLLDILDNETVVEVLNDLLLNIRSSTVNIKIENGDALTITSDKYGDVKDIDILLKLKFLGINKIFIDDFNTNIIFQERHKIEPFPGDAFGYCLSITNSETGFSAIQIQDYLLRYVCSNGAYMYNYGVNKKFYHYKLNVDDVFNLMNESIINHIINVFEVEKKLKKLNVNTNEFEIFDLNRKIFKQTSINLLRDLLNTERPITRYELMNIITERAKEFPFYKRKKIETIAGEMIS